MRMRLGDAASVDKLRQYCSDYKLSAVCDARRVACLKEIEKVQSVATDYGWIENTFTVGRRETQHPLHPQSDHTRKSVDSASPLLRSGSGIHAIGDGDLEVTVDLAHVPDVDQVK